MNKFKFVFAHIFKAMKCTLGLVLSYVILAALMMLASGLIYSITGEYLGTFTTVAVWALAIVFFFIGFAGFIDTIILQVKSYE